MRKKKRRLMKKKKKKKKMKVKKTKKSLVMNLMICKKLKNIKINNTNPKEMIKKMIKKMKVSE